ncbi:MAG: DNA topoisomerase 1 [Candidatus Anoxychlamydiales bacterium]|nr:DNA topoisomerase 1 [Candidatus Anoxychlamydiales bacterium]
MKKHLVIVESPTKIKTLKKFLGPNYIIESSVGHIRDLPQKEFGIDVENDFDPKYVNIPEKKDVIKKLKEASKKSDVVYLCPDPDREGEAIAWHISEIIPKNIPTKRVTFNSITKQEVLNAFKKPRKIDKALVDAQQARRILDRMVGYKISPILSRKLKRSKGTSAGRVQSVALKLVVEREKEIEKFKSIEYWNIKTTLDNQKKEKEFNAFVYSVDGKKVEKEKINDKKVFLISDKKTADSIVKKLKDAKYSVSKVEKKEKKRNPVPPFITSTLQQEASRHFGFNASRTMGIAQSLYEGVDLKDMGFEGLITYMRTDSVSVVKEAITTARTYVKNKFGSKYLPEKPIVYKSKKSAQEAHEAIRPTNLYHDPETVKKYLNSDQYKLYKLIWKRFVASQMTSAIYDTISLDIDTNKKILLRASGSTIKFPGFLKLYVEKIDHLDESEDKDNLLPNLKVKDTLKLINLDAIQSFTKPPARYTEASLIKELEKSGIGRPSTYASIMNKIQSRDYTSKDRLALKPTELGKIIIQLLESNFTPIVNVGFTAAMEDDLEMVAENKKNWKTLIKEFWKEFFPMVKKAEKEAVVPKITTEKKCPKCKKPLQKIWSKSKYFYGCSAYPDCDYTAPVESMDFNKEDYAKDFDWDQECPKCKAKMNLRFGRYGAFLGCSNYPKCQGIVNIPKKDEELLRPEDRPNCVAVGCDGKIVMRRSRRGKNFYSCTNYPDCDVIVNHLDDLEKKYGKKHPKTPYQKREFVKGEKGKRGSGKYEVSKELEKIVKEKTLSRGDILKKVWEYIKKHKLQDPKNKRLIVPDANLAKVFGSKDSIDMMKLSGILKNHMKR